MEDISSRTSKDIGGILFEQKFATNRFKKAQDKHCTGKEENDTQIILKPEMMYVTLWRFLTKNQPIK